MKKTAMFLFVFVFWFVLASSQFMFLAYANPDLAGYYPSAYNLLGSTTYVSGSLDNLTSNDDVYMTFRSYGTSTSELFPIANMNFTGSANGWSTTTNILSGTATFGYDDSNGNPSGSGLGSYFHKAELTTDYSNLITNGNFTSNASGWVYGEASDENSWASGAWSSTGGRTDSGCYIVTVVDNAARVIDTSIEAWIDYKVAVESLPSTTFIQAAYNLTTSGKGETIDVKIQLILPNSSIVDIYTSSTYTSSTPNYTFVNVDVTEYVNSLGNYTVRLYHSQTTGDKAADKITTKLYWDDAAFSVSVPVQADITFTSETTFSYNYGTPLSAYLSHAYTLNGDSIGNGSSLTVRLIKPDNTTVDLDSVNLPSTQVSWTYKTGIPINATYFSQSGTYKLQLISHLISNETGTYIQLNFDDIGIKLTYYSGYTAEVEFSGSSNTYSWMQIIWTVDSSWTTENVSVTLQLFNYTLGDYPTSGNGYISYTSSSASNTDETKNQTINVNPEDFRDSSGNWKIKITGIKSTTSQFELKVDFIEFKVEYENLPPVASFTESAETAYTGETITFNASASYDPDGTIVSYYWDFGDGTNATGAVVDHAYADDGTYVVTLTVTDDKGATDTATATKTILNRTPIASFTESAETVYTGESITFNASGSYDPDGSIVSYYWDFGDGSNATGIVVSHSYADDGNYTVTLTVTDEDGATGTASSTKTVLNRSPVASFTETTETAYTGETITFNASGSYDPDGSIVSYFWDFGDGTNATGIVVDHSYADNGNYTVRLTVMDDDGASSTVTSTKNILNRPPVASFTESAETVYIGEPITFNASSSYDSDGSIVSYFWDFGDGTNATGVVVEHAYSNNGTYLVTLTVTDDDGATAATTSTKTILYNEPPVASFTESAETVYTGETITFNASASYDPDGNITSYYWDFGDGTNATGVVVDHSYVENGTYTVTLTVTDDRGATSSSTASKTILNRSPIASFTESAETVYTSETITFNASSSYDPDGTVVSYFWDFGDGSNATGAIVQHAYSDNGNYTVTLTVTDNDGATSTATSTKTILNTPPVASFTESAETVYTSDIITFNASSSYDSDGSIVSYFWDFGDGTNATGAVVEHSYVDNGNYTVILTVTDDDGATASTTSTKTVLNRSPIASFTESAETIYTGESITFNASSSYDPDGSIVSYYWDFGDGSNASGVVVTHSYVENANYTVTLTITDNDGATASTSATKTVLNRPPVVSFTESAETVYTSETITFNASSSYDPDGTIVSYFWDFGDGWNATGMVVDHAYADDGNYTVTLIVTDDDGATASTTSTKTVLNRSPIASFTESAETAFTGESITFNASSSYDPDGSIVSYFWDFGDGSNSSGVTVTHAYADNGTYTVTLTVTDDDGATSSATSVKTVLNTPPVASFTESAETVYTGDTITFNASSSYDPDGSIVSYYWDFGDGSNSTGVVVNHVYTVNGNYTVTLTVTDDDGESSTATSTKTILNRSPVASFTESAETVYTGETITFNASNSYDPDGTVVSYFWDFGDGSNASGVVVTHSYADNGNYVVTLTITDDDGATASTTAIKTILNRSPVASFTESAEMVYTGEAITFNASGSYDPDGSIVSYFWDFGDGTNATGVIVEHAFNDNGNYTVTLTVTDDDGANDTATSTKTVLNRPPVASFTESSETVYTGETITFNASSSYDSDGSIVSYYWDFGDGSNATGVVVSHSYLDNGTYTVTLTVTDDDGAFSTATSTKNILNSPPIASFTESAETVYTSETITFNASGSYDPDGSIVSYFWDFGDGSNATGVTVEHAYASNGNYVVTLTVTDDDGATASTTSTKTVLNRSPVASFTESAETIYTGESITFNASGSYDPDGSITSYHWDFGDGSNATGVVVNHTYADDGNYTVTLTVTDDDGASSTATSSKTVLNRSPIASFTESAETVYTGESITFNASGSYDSDGSIVSYFWDFGDGTNATGVVVSHAYADDGNYTVTLTVTDDDGAISTATSIKTILNRSPVASFTESAETVYTGESITFDASDSYDSDGTIISYFWDFGDGSNASGVVVTHSYTDNGTYVVSLTVTDNDGATTTTSATKTVLNRSPVASFTESAETVYTSDSITFNASSSYDPDGFIVSYFWDFGDGTNASGVVVTHSYVENANYTVILTVTDNDGATASTSATKTVLNRSPVASFTESAETAFTGESITFNASSSYDSDGSIVSYYWDFGDGSNSSGVTVTHAYADNGTYTVTLTVTDDDGATSSAVSVKTILNRQPVALFTESAETVYTSETITFNATQSYDPDGTIVSYYWDFGDGSNTTGAVVGHAYVDDGVYTVTLTVTDDDGATASTTATKTILNRSPIASFSESAETVYTNEIITFNASGSYDPDGTIVSYFWDFGDGANSSGVTVTHAYADNGTYTVTLTVTDDDGATSSATSVKTVLNTPPVASFTESAESVYTSETITFNASSSYDPDGTIVSYFWDFGDGTNATGVTVEHFYSENGNYTVTLLVTDNDGAATSATALKTILNRLPVASFTESAETVYTGITITFDASASYDPDGSIVSYFWDFGDGTNATGVSVGHAYADNGNYTVTLTVTDDDGATSTAASTKNILNRSPVAKFTSSKTTAYTGESITFDATESYDPDGIIVSYFWDFGDGSNATGVVVSHSYADDGTYIVSLTVTDDDNATGTATATVNILNRPPTASFAESAETAYTGEEITFNASSSYDSDGSIVSYFWDFGDGTNATGIVVYHTYGDNGTYTVTLTVTDDDGATASTTATKTIMNRPPIAAFTESAETVIVGETIYFNASSSYDPDGSIVSYYWDFGDGTNATGIYVEHSYSSSGVYTVTLFVTDNDGDTSSTSSTKNVEVTPPVAVFTESAETVYTGEAITFNASDSYDPDGSIVSYYWNFGDGTNATGVVVEHSYADDGNYTVMLTVTDNDGATDTATAIKTILNRSPTALFVESAETVYTGEAITFNASDSYDPDGSIVSYFWDFGDGTNTTGISVSHAYADNGTYVVTLTVTDDDGASSSTTASKTILNKAPTASFTESAETAYTSEAITFNASSSYDSDGSIVSYYWDFGDGSNATGVVVTHLYAENGTYTVTLTVTDDDGDTATTSSTKTILNRPPTASFTESKQTVLTSEAITFNASASYDPDGFIVSYYWDFGDGANATGVVVTHSYSDDGNYTVILTVTDNDNTSSSTTATKTVLNRPPIASFTESAETVYTSETITFNASSSYDPDGSITSYFWDFGDGTNATGVIVEHSYTENGTYTVTLTVTDDDDASSSTSAIKSVGNSPPVASFTESSETVYTGEAITFNASSSYDPDGFIVSYFWDFGDGTNATGVAVEHAYADDGAYTVTLTVTDDDGATSTANATKTILNNPPIASFTESAETVYTSEAITFNASGSYDSDGSIVSYFWDFGDGTNATGVVVSHLFADNANYTVTLTVTDDDGAISTATSIKTVLNRSPLASFTESAQTVLTDETITFNASGSYDPDGSIVSYYWDFGDGTNATGIVVSHAYADNGNYTVTLTVTDDDGASSTATAIKTVQNRFPVASFTESAESVLTGQIIYFNASASYDPDGTIVSYFWDFGDGTNATGVAVEHAYAHNGTYTVTLTVTDDDGAISSTSAVKSVGNSPPVASFTESAETVYTGITITFDASASYDPDGSIVSYYWDFGDGTNATGVSVGHAYSDNGTYTVTLTVTDDDGATDTAASTKTILNRSPVASFTESATTVSTDTVIYFDASASYDPDGVITSYFWDFGDGTNATGVTVEHAYVDDGSYVVTLTVTDDDGATATASAVKSALNRPPVASFTESAETVYTSETIVFNASSSYDSDGNITSYYWDFGDGTNATGVIVEHSYTENGTYTVTLTVTDDDGATTSSSATKTVLNRSPVASFSESAENVVANEIIYFNASSSYDPDGAIVSYFWDFGDGTNATGVAVEHAYSSSGIYTVTLTVTDNDGATDTASAVKTVEITPPVAVFTESAETVYTSEPITFNASDSYDPDGSIVSYYWDFGDGTNATGAVVTHSYNDNGNYTVTLTVTDNDGATDTTSAIKTILNSSPIASFSESAETVYIGQIITFNASSSYDPDGAIVSYFWDFGDGTNATGIVVEHAYTNDGNYTVTLTVTDDDGAFTSTSAVKTILWNDPPVAVFTESNETAYTGEIIYFNASSSYDPDGTIVSYFWDFGDGTNATGVTVEHSYTENGTYEVTLTIMDNVGASSSSTATKTILNRSPVALFTESSETVYTGETIMFNASASYDPDGSIVSYFWNFGDGTNATGVVVEHSYADNGTYTVTLNITDNDGVSNSSSSVKTVLNRSPVALFTESSETAYTGQIITFNASASYDPDGSIVSYYWDFGDGTNATGVTTSHSYLYEGNYTVTLSITDNDGAVSVTNATKTILWNDPPIAAFTESAETIFKGSSISFNASASYDPDGNITSYYWDFGDGTNATGVYIEHVYVEEGNYTVTLTVTDDRGINSTATATKTVTLIPPVAIFSESAETVYTDDVIVFNASASYDPDGSIVSYFWDFGDGTNATGDVVQHSYPENGQYIVTLTITDNEGAVSSANATKTVLNRPPIVILTASKQTAYTGETIVFNASSSYDPDGTIVWLRWDFGDGRILGGKIYETTHSYDDNGTYVVILKVTDNDGGVGNATVTINILNRPPIANFTISPETGYLGSPITFNASSSYDSDGSIVSYFWDFGDGTNATGVLVEHIYMTNGTFTITLTVEDNDYSTNSTSKTLLVLYNDLPVPIFTESAETVYTDESILFNASASYDSDGTIVSYYWDLGDGSHATGEIVNHAYSENGTYIVTLYVEDDRGAVSAVTSIKTVLNRPPVALFTESAETVYVYESIVFDASASYDPDGTIVSYYWDFGDGTNATGVSVEHTYLFNGTFTVTLTVTDNDGSPGSASSLKTVLFSTGIQDVAVLNMTASVTEILKYHVLNLTVVVKNEGSDIETFNITFYRQEVRGWHLIEVDGRRVWYSDGENSLNSLLYTVVNVSAADPVLTFDTKYDIEYLYDYGFVQVSIDGGLTWESLGNQYTTYNYSSGTDPSIIENLPGLTGTSVGWPGWMSMTFNLSNYAGETVLIGFRYMTDHGTLNEGWYIDNVQIGGNSIPDQAFKLLDPPPSEEILTYTVRDLPPNSQTTITVPWNTSTTRSGKYSISCVAETLRRETDTADNTFLDGVVEVKPNPDINGDNRIDILDVVAVTSIYGLQEGDPNWNPKADLIEDGLISILDVVAVTSHYGEKY